MSAAALNAVAQAVRRLSGIGQTDGQLLERFFRQHDETAYGELIKRHGPMILAVCRRVLRHHHDAEDAFQATFLVLARKGAAIRDGQSVGGWLFQVAYRLALRLRAAERRRRAAPLSAMASEPIQSVRDTGDGVRAILDEELTRLPDQYRAAVVLCYLEGRSQFEAARLLATTPDAVNSRLKRARELLRRRLSRHGFAVGAGLIASAWSPAAPAAPPSLIASTAQAAVEFAMNLAVSAATARVVTLAQGALRAMTPMKTILGSLLLLIGCLLAAAGGIRADAPAPPGADSGEAKKDAPTGEKAGSGAKGEARRHCILLWMSGGPSQMDTFDLKPGMATGGPFKAIPTATKGVTISEHLPRLAKLTNHLALLRTVSHREGDHMRGAYLMRTGRAVGGKISYPPFAAVLAKELGDDAAGLPGWVSIAPTVVVPRETYGPGFLEPRFGPLLVAASGGLEPMAGASLPLPALEAFKTIAGDKSEKMRAAIADAFKLKEEKDALRDAYGRTRFGQGCLLARRLVERGVPVVEVGLGGWDTHGENFAAVKRLSAELDAGFATLLTDLRDKKMLDRTLIVWMGEFGRTPRINASTGRDHWPLNFSVVLGGAGVKGGQAIGETNADGAGVKNGAIAPEDLIATIYRAVGVDPAKEIRPKGGEKMPLVEKGAQVVKEALR
ncbi:MAG: sigma-70 family RNA polymerase sigma factor [Gemmataceae bacterium]